MCLTGKGKSSTRVFQVKARGEGGGAVRIGGKVSCSGLAGHSGTDASFMSQLKELSVPSNFFKLNEHNLLHL